MRAPSGFATWLNDRSHVDRKTGIRYLMHPRSDAHSIYLCELIVHDLLAESPVLADQARRGQIGFGINLSHTWPSSRKAKTIDLAIGKPVGNLTPPADAITQLKVMSEVLISCEAKATMTEHGKSKPRLFDELSSSHEIVHKGRTDCIAAGIEVVNIANTFASPLRNKSAGSAEDLEITPHRQPGAAKSIVEHLRHLDRRTNQSGEGFEAFGCIVVSTDNLSYSTLWTDDPAPQPGDPDHYETFIRDIVGNYEERFA
ncbi:MAG: hypothetical protein K8I27_07100 [Planctomycetes bacterium]|nr:hypothetical protein [Planctomycetota bacterium]